MLLPGEADAPVGVPLNEFIVSGGNRLGVVLHSGPLASRSTDPWPDAKEASDYAGPAKLTLRLAQYADNQPVHKDGPPAIHTIEWDGAAAPTPVGIEREFPVSTPLGGWAWEGAQRFESLTDGVRSAAMEYLAGLHAMLAAGRFDEFVEASAIKIEEYARAYGIAAGPVRATMRQALASETAGLKLRPLDPSEIDLRLVAGGRMIQCLRTDRHDALEYAGAPGGPTFFLPAMIGATASGWRLLR
jgi:hypothetical protein